MFIAAFLAVIALLYAFGWAPDFQAIFNAVVAGGRALIVTPLTDVGALFKRVALAVAAILILALALPAGHTGTHAELKYTIEAYQSAHGLTPDGIWGSKTNKMYLSGN